MAVVERREQSCDDSVLSDRDREMLELERLWWKYAGAKEQAIRDKFDMSATRYYQILNSLIDTEAALCARPAAGQAVASPTSPAPAPAPGTARRIPALT